MLKMNNSALTKYSLILLLVIPLRSFCQHAVIAATKMNVLYIGVDNPITFAVENTSCNDLTIALEKGKAEKTGECNYNIVVTKPGATLIYIIKGKDTISKSTYRIKNIPDPVTSWHNDGPFWFRIDSLRTQHELKTITKHFDFNDEFKIVSFETTIIRNKQVDKNKNTYCNECFEKIEKEHYETVFSGVNQGAEFNDSLKEFIRNKLIPGDKFFIENIRVLAPDNRIRMLNPLVFSVQ